MATISAPVSLSLNLGSGSVVLSPHYDGLTFLTQDVTVVNNSDRNVTVHIDPAILGDTTVAPGQTSVIPITGLTLLLGGLLPVGASISMWDS